MTGPEHYVEAERLISLSQGSVFESDGAAYAGQAQVHATLALAAATAESLPADIEARIQHLEFKVGGRL